MPELPEVETLAAQLRRVLAGREIEGFEIRNAALLETPLRQFKENLRGKKIQSVNRRAKFIQIDLEGNWTLWFHLGMTGQLLLVESLPDPLPTHSHFILRFRKEQNVRAPTRGALRVGTRPTPTICSRLIYRDIRRFGSIALTPTDENAFPPGVRNLGPEPWECDAEEFVSLFKARRAPIKSLLLNQTLVSGLGNIYSDESLYRAGIRPVQRANRLTRSRLRRLHEVLCEVLEEAIRWGGSSIDDYLHADGTRGRFQEFHRVYGRRGEACGACGQCIRSVKLAGRTSSFCPECQK